MGIHTGQILHQRYSIGEHLGKGQANTFAAVRLADDSPVIIKELKLGEIENWKAYELFQRELSTLQNLDHRAFPRLLDHFEVKIGEAQGMYLVLERIPGRNLQEAMQAGWRPEAKEVKNLALQALDALIYLHGLAPPLIHRDIKPSNLIWHEQRLYLIDFGAVQDMMRPEGSSTIVGTFGYMAPEQFSGRAVPASDLYALGATLVHLLSGRSPGELPQRELRLDFRDYVSCSEPFLQWLEHMLEPLSEYRFKSAAEAKSALLEERLASESSRRHPQHTASSARRTTGPLPSLPIPLGTKIKITRDHQRLEIKIPPGLFKMANLFLIGFNAFWLCFVAVWTGLALQGSIFFALFSLPFWAVGLGMLAFNINNMFTRTELHFSPQHIHLLKNYAQVFKQEHHYPLSQLNAVQRQLSYKSNNTPHFNLQLEIGSKKIGLGSHLSRAEQDWLKNEILGFAQQHLSKPQSETLLRLSESSESTVY